MSKTPLDRHSPEGLEQILWLNNYLFSESIEVKDLMKALDLVYRFTLSDLLRNDSISFCEQVIIPFYHKLGWPVLTASVQDAITDYEFYKRTKNLHE